MYYVCVCHKQGQDVTQFFDGVPLTAALSHPRHFAINSLSGVFLVVPLRALLNQI